MAPTVQELTDPHLRVFTRVPSAQEEAICPICHVARDPVWRTCLSCDRTRRGVSRPLDLVVPITLYKSYSQMGRWLRRYKDPDGVTRAQQARFSAILAATFGRFLVEHGHCVREAAGTGWDVITTVPSTQRPAPHPFSQVVDRLEWSEQQRTLLARAGGPVAHNQSGDTVYRTTENVEGLSVLIADDTWTSGAHLQSAASALSNAGANVVAAVIVGRVVRTDWHLTPEDWWQEQREPIFNFDICCLE